MKRENPDREKENSGLKDGEREILSAKIEVWQNPDTTLPYTINIVYPEFTCLCPINGYPDFATLDLKYVPDDFIVELKSFKLYLNSYRYRYISHEEASISIYKDFKRVVKPLSLELTMKWNPRGNMSTIITLSSEEEKINRQKKQWIG